MSTAGILAAWRRSRLRSTAIGRSTRVSAFNRGVADWLSRLPTVWVEGEVTELRRQQRWASVFLTLKDPADGSCLRVSMPRGQFDALRLDLVDGERVHVYGRPELFEARGDLRFRALSIERFGLGDHLAALERLKRKLAAEGLFERRRPLRASRPADRARDRQRRGREAGCPDGAHDPLPAARRGAETYVQGPRAAPAIVEAIGALCEIDDVDVIVLARGGGASRTCCRSATSAWCGPWLPAGFRSSRLWATSRTRR